MSGLPTLRIAQDSAADELLSRDRRAALGLDPPDLVTVKQRTGQGPCVLALRFTADKGCPAERFATLRRELGAALEGIEIDSSPGNPDGIRPSAHAVLTGELVDEPGHPTRAALDRVMEFLQQRLQTERAGPTDA